MLSVLCYKLGDVQDTFVVGKQCRKKFPMTSTKYLLIISPGSDDATAFENGM